eukprot:CAMPEP_0175358480 /NCGR_PEP_ID=MMETSP0095-20121207/15020_1 /TAXON_ID=311494 /ORGANISM="Alexandrium monilatum, Strain CCMP3105" /LENGTH=365 /DNA_ID=CAMNT_0016656211 /DNA_START=10 /DNA_END=1107 /DNA_ORIENTATION=-
MARTPTLGFRPPTLPFVPGSGHLSTVRQPDFGPWRQCWTHVPGAVAAPAVAVASAAAIGWRGQSSSSRSPRQPPCQGKAVAACAAAARTTIRPWPASSQTLRRAFLRFIVFCGVAAAALSYAVAPSAAFEVSGAAAEASKFRQALAAAFEVLQNAGWIGYACHVLLFSLWITLSLPTTVIELATGFLYGPVFGFLCSILCKSVGQMCAFLVVLTLRKRRGWQVPAALKPKLQAIRSKPLLAMVSVRLTPLPLGIKNYGLAMCEVDFLPYMLAGVMVNTPFSVIWALTGSSCLSLSEALAFDMAGTGGSSGRMLGKAGAVVAIVVLTLAGLRRLRSSIEDQTPSVVDDQMRSNVEASGDAAGVAAN